ncbi:hypothetical protein Trydic_g15144 [Trypoxylus dichotomus]
MDKLYKGLVKERLEAAISEGGGLSERQVSFRKGRSTIHAVNIVVEILKKSELKWNVMIAFDIKNALNSTSWSFIIKEFRKRNIPRRPPAVSSRSNIIEHSLRRSTGLEVATLLANTDDLAVVIGAGDPPQVVYRINEY